MSNYSFGKLIETFMQTTSLARLMFLLLLAAAMLSLASSPAHASAEPDATLGVWRGTIGSAQIMACFVPYAIHDSSYYYLRHRTSIRLTHMDSPDSVWLEGDAAKPRVTWHLTLSKGGRLKGTWTDNVNQGAKPYSVDLARLAFTTSRLGDECGEEASTSYKAFNKPRGESEISHVQTFGDKTLVSVMKGAIAIVLPPNTRDASVIGHEAKSWLDEKVSNLYSCQFNFDSMKSEHSRAFHFRYRLYIQSRSPRWLVGTELGSKYCGDDNQVQSDQDAFVWNLDANIEINPWTWIANAKAGCPETCHNAPPSTLHALIVKLTHPNPDNPECVQLVRDNDTYFTWPTSRGLVFAGVVYASRDCDYKTEVPYDALQTFLTKAGKSAAKSFKSEQAPDLHTFGL
jgi:hypothetical protein